MKNKYIKDTEARLKNTLMNLSNKELTPTEQTITCHFFSIWPKHIPKFDILSAIEKSARKLRSHEGNEYTIRTKNELEIIKH